MTYLIPLVKNYQLTAPLITSLNVCSEREVCLQTGTAVINIEAPEFLGNSFKLLIVSFSLQESQF